MRIYLAGATAELDQCAHYRDRLREIGHEITHDWISQVRDTIGPDHELSHETRHACALDDMRGVLRADLVWILAPQPTNVSCGCWVELGMALAASSTIVVSGPWKRCIFADLTPHRYDHHDVAFSWIRLMSAAVG